MRRCLVNSAVLMLRTDIAVIVLLSVDYEWQVIANEDMDQCYSHLSACNP